MDLIARLRPLFRKTDKSDEVTNLQKQWIRHRVVLCGVLQRSQSTNWNSLDRTST